MKSITTSLKGLEVLALLRVVNEIAETENIFPVDFIWGMTKTRKELVSIAELIEEKRASLVKKYGKENKEGVFNIDKNTKEWHSFINDYTGILDSSFNITINGKPYSELESCFKQNNMKTVSNIYMFFEHFVYDTNDSVIEDLAVEIETPNENGKSEKVLEKV